MAIDSSVNAYSFAFPEHQVHEAADEGHGKADPGQDVGGAVGACLQVAHVEGVLLGRVDGRSHHHAQRGQQLDDGGEDESLSLLEPEQLQDEDEEAYATEDGRQDHGGLDRLQVGCVRRVALGHRVAGFVTSVPQVRVDHVIP